MIGRFVTIALSSLLLASTNATPFKSKVAQTANTKKASHISRLVNKATNLRRLDEEEEWEIDLSDYSIKFVKCQFIKSYDDEMAEQEDAGTVMRTDRFVIFRLCPSSSCSYNYGEYLVDMETYLQSAVEYEQEQRENMCQYCEEVCAADDDGRRQLRRLDEEELKVDCDVCVDECAAYEDMEENGYLDATNFIECQQVGEDDDDASEQQYFVGALCASSGTSIKLGVFLDEDCSVYDSSLSVENYLEQDDNGGAFTISYDLLEQTYNTSNRIPCVEPDWEVPEEEDENADDQNQNDEEEEVEINQMCEELYEASAKCESVHGFDQYHANDEAFYNQAAQEELVCSFLKTIGSGSYDQSGDIVLNSKLVIDEDAEKATGTQKFMLFVLIVGTAGFAYYAMTLHSALMKYAKGLSSQGGAVA